MKTKKDGVKFDDGYYKRFQRDDDPVVVDDAQVERLVETLPSQSLNVFQAAVTELHRRFRRSHRYADSVVIEHFAERQDRFSDLHSDTMTAAAADLLRESIDTQKQYFLLDWFEQWWRSGGWEVVFDMMKDRYSG